MTVGATINSILVAVILASGMVAAGPATAQSYPAKPIRLLVPTAPGATSDITARIVAQKLTASFGQSVVVDNRPGGGGAVGTEAAVRANPDGYTMILVSASYATNAALYPLSYDPVNDVTPIALIGETGLVLVVNPSVPVSSVKELITYDRANPGKLNYGSAGSGSTPHLVAELFNQMAGTRTTHVPYKGTGPALNDLLGAQIQLIFGGMAPMIPLVKSNRLRGIAVTSGKRSNAIPDIPTVAETIPGYAAVSWVAVLGPKALPRDIVTRWNMELDRIVRLPDVKERLVSDGIEPVGGPAERFREVLRRDVAKWQSVVKLAGIKPAN